MTLKSARYRTTFPPCDVGGAVPGWGLGPPKGMGLSPGPPGCRGPPDGGPIEFGEGPDAEAGRDCCGPELLLAPKAGLGGCGPGARLPDMLL